LENIFFFGTEPRIKPWEESLRTRLREREQRQQKISLKKEFMSLSLEQVKIEAAKLNVCWRCLEPITYMMIDCTKCGAIQ
jgi:hypothetical protein